ncbi:gamma-glutamyl-gamma-aminobutyrate hydrolase family protein [Sutterella megalosphaeroides]|uniref:Peptidase C26 n=1 Tax=Sutterella megalosphaeroides TaxID=2494234 RepID=A0A2Z6IA33_9BURK|nr:gamma-glutamyl-gamma-aminobutyrate hydrolase family protein [Sutterella megalosphaeroides]BBF23224.1 peptidase C26 [Sutterella megalosphaeroides]
MLAGKPLIGLTPARFREAGVVGTRAGYEESIRAAGGVPLVLPFAEEAVLDALFEELDGLLLTGGVDVDPRLYGETPQPECGPIETERDRLELQLIRKAWEKDLPILAVCRGAQILNAAMGGTLYQDLPSELGLPPERHSRRDAESLLVHEVRTVPGTRISEWSGTQLGVNSLHHQAVKRLAPVFVPAAYSAEDDVLEGFEAPEKRFVIAVQWHPERLSTRQGEAARLFEEFVKACANE